MKHTKHLARTLVAGVAAATITAAPDAVEAKPAGPDVPNEITVPAGHKVFLVGRAVGVQIYSCNATPTGPSWGFVAPRANLYDDKGKLLTTHYAGPRWQAKDGSTVLGARVSGVTVDPTAIPWLLLEAASTTEGPWGDRLTKTAYIQRTATTGGLTPPAASCNADTTGTTVEVPYTADYHFWKATGRASD